MPRDYITIVSGLPRSGTSLMMQMLDAGGLPAFTDGLRKPDADNPRGYLEHEAVKRLERDSSWMPQAQGHAIKVIHLLLRHLPLDRGLRYRIVFLRRNLDEVLASQDAMLRRAGKIGVPAPVLRRAFESQLEAVSAWLLTQRDLPVLFVDHHRVLRTPEAVAADLCGFLGKDLDVAAMTRSVEPALHRHQAAARPSEGADTVGRGQ